MKKDKHETSLLYFSNAMAIQLYLINFKLQLRNFLISNSKKILNIKVVLGCFPIIFGISKTLYSKYQYDSLLSVLEHTLPGISPLSTKISWPTLEQIFLNQLQFNSTLSCNPNINQTYIKRVDFYNDSVLIQTNFNWHTKQKQIYIGTFYGLEQTQIQARKQIGNNWYTTFSRNKKKYSSIDKSKQKKNWNLYSSHNANNNFTLYFNHKLNTITNKNNYILNLDELPLKLDWSSIFKQFFPNNILKNNTPITKVKFEKRKEKINSKQIQKNNLSSKLSFSVDNFSMSSANIKSGDKITQKKTLFFSQKIFDSKIKNFLLAHAKKSTSYLCFTIPLKGIQNKNLQIGIQSGKTNLGIENVVEKLTEIENNFSTLEPSSSFSKIVFIKKKFLENKLKENFYSKNFPPFLNFSDLHFSTNSLKQKKLKAEINILLDSIYSKKWALSANEILDLIQFIEEITIFHENHVVKPSVMSGYLAPDTTNEQNISLVVKFLYKNSNQLLHTILLNSFKPLWNPILEINIPRNFSYSLNFLNRKSSLPVLKFSPQSQATHYFFSYAQEKNIYEGPSIAQHKITNELNGSSPIQLKQWMRQFLNSDTSLSDRREIFFGKNLYAGPLDSFASQSLIGRQSNGKKRSFFLGSSPQNHNYYSEQTTTSDYFFSKQQKLDKIKRIQVGLLKKGRTMAFFEMPLKPSNSATRQKNANGEVRLSYKEILEPRSTIASNEYPYVVYLDQKEWKTFFEKLSEEKTELIPIANVKFPKKKWHIWPLTQSNSKNVNDLIISNFGKQINENTVTRYFANASTKLRSKQKKMRQNSIQNFSLPNLQPKDSKNLPNKTSKACFTRFSEPCFVNVSPPQRQALEKTKFFPVAANQRLAGKATKESSVLQNKDPLAGAGPCKHQQKEKHYLNFYNIPISYHYFPYSPTLLKETLPKKYFFAKAYKKHFSIYANKSIHKNRTNKFAALFYESVEPISIDSWLFVAQFSIGLLLLNILQNIAQKYGKEMKYGISSLLDGKSESSSVIDNTLNGNDDNFRLIKNIEKNFHNIAGINSILPELSEIVWFLRNSGRSFKVGNTIPRRILLTGPPGTGKTLLVQAIAGEAEVPVLIESGSSLNQPGSSENGSERLKNIFHKARQIAPCIIFIDEIDTFGEARNQMVENPVINTEILDCISLHNTKLAENKFQVENFDFIPQSKFSVMTEAENSVEQSDSQNDNSNDSSNNLPLDRGSSLLNQINKNVNQKNFNKYSSTQQKANLLMQFLIELDGIATEKKILVFGATNRPQVLDAALTRPGRFNKIFNLNLPNKQKRIEILKLYSKNLGAEIQIPWNYLANLTAGLSAADLASVMNQSSMKAIQTETIHTVQTIEYGIESITGYSTQKNQLKSFTKLRKNESIKHQLLVAVNQKEIASKSVFINRLSYYQAGKAVVHSLLKSHPQVISVHLWPEVKNTRYHLINGIIEKEFSQIRTRVELESRIIGFYAGKAAELLALVNGFSIEKNQNKKHTLVDQINKNKFLYSWQSDLGVQDMSFAGWLAQLMITKWYLYSKQVCIEKLHRFPNNSNVKNIPDYQMLELFKQLSYEIETESNHNIISTPVYLEKQGENSQTWIAKFSLQKQITKKLEFFYLNNTNWYKIYEGDHEESENTRCVAPDEYYHNNTYLKNLLNNKFQSTQPESSALVAKLSTKQNFPYITVSTKLKDKQQKKTSFKSSLTWLDVALSNRDDFYHSLILACFNKSISILDKNRELLDFFASYLIQKEIIREHEITKIINNFKTNGTNINNQQNNIPESFVTHLNRKKVVQQSNIESTILSQKQNKNFKIPFKKTKEIVQKNWSKWSKKKSFRFINFQNL